VKKNGTWNYYGNFGYYAYEYRKRSFSESKYTKNVDNIFYREDLKNTKLFILDVALSLGTNDYNPWLVYSIVSIHMTCNKDWLKIYHDRTNGGNIYLG
jgi:hypothetical protein